MGVDLTDRKKEVMELFMDVYFNFYDPIKVFWRYKKNNKI